MRFSYEYLYNIVDRTHVETVHWNSISAAISYVDILEKSRENQENCVVEL